MRAPEKSRRWPALHANWWARSRWECIFTTRVAWLSPTPPRRSMRACGFWTGPWAALGDVRLRRAQAATRSEEHTSELQSLMRNSYAVFCLKKKKTEDTNTERRTT